MLPFFVGCFSFCSCFVERCRWKKISILVWCHCCCLVAVGMCACMFSRISSSHRLLHHVAFIQRLIVSIYFCILFHIFRALWSCHSVLSSGYSGIIECKEPIEVVSYKIGVCKVSAKGKECTTVFQKLGYNGKSSVVLCKPKTGRMHQIRVHLQFLGEYWFPHLYPV